MEYQAVHFSQCTRKAYEYFIELAAIEGLEAHFTIIPDPIHGDSGEACEAIQQLQHIAPFEAPYYNAFNIRISSEEASRILETVPGEAELWREVAGTFYEAYLSTKTRS